MLAWREVEKYTSSVEPEPLISLRNVVLTFGVPFSAVFVRQNIKYRLRALIQLTTAEGAISVLS